MICLRDDTNSYAPHWENLECRVLIYMIEFTLNNIQNLPLSGCEVVKSIENRD